MQPKKIVFVCGSPRKAGNTVKVSQIAIKAARDHGAEVTQIDATQLQHSVPGCRSCMKCQQSEGYRCLIGDQLAETVAALVHYDVIVLAVPTYWMSYPAQVKMFVDRMGSLMKYSDVGSIQTPLAGKTFALLATGNGVLENNLDLLEQQWGNVAAMMSCSYHSCLLPRVPMQASGLLQDSAVQEKVYAFGKYLASA